MSSHAETGYRIIWPFEPHEAYGAGMQRLAHSMSRLLEEPERGFAALLEIDPERRAYVLSYLDHLAPMYRLVHLLCETREVRSINELQSSHLNFSLMHCYLDDLAQGLNQVQLLHLTHIAQVAGLLEPPE